MKEKRILDVLSQADEQYIEEAAPGGQKPGKRSWMKWGALAACLVLLSAIGIPYLSKHRGKAEPPEQSDPGTEQPVTEQPAEPSGTGQQSHDPADFFREYGLSAKAAENLPVTGGETPFTPREEAVRFLHNAVILDCTIDQLTRITIQEPRSGYIWCITAMKLSLNAVIRGDTEEKQFSVVNAARTNSRTEFLTYPGLEDCKEQLRAAFVLKKIGDDDVWTIGDGKIPVKNLGDYYGVCCMGFDGESLHYLNYDIPLSELE